MIGRALLGLCVVVALSFGQGAPDAVKVKAAVAEIERVFRDGDGPARVKAVQAAAQFVDPEVIARIAKGLKDKDLEVERAAMEALRFMPHPEAAKALVDAAKRDPRFKKAPERHAALLRAIAQHGAEDSIEVLAADLGNENDAGVLRARIWGLGRVRSKASVDKLIELLRALGPTKSASAMPDFRTALMVLTGVDQGTSGESWIAWWTAERARSVIAARPAALPRAAQYAWDLYWGEDRPTDRPVPRADRGKGDPEK